MSETPPVCDYEGSDYKSRFWENQGRDYEDQSERVALRRMLPPAGERLLDVGAGFGRLAGEYNNFKQVVLFDYSRSLLQEARAKWGNDPRLVYVAGDWYKMPFVAGTFDTLVQVRTIHHAADVPALLQQLRRITRPGATYILEFANKRNLKAILRYTLGRQTWSPHTPEPVEFVPLNFDFHPQWLRQQLTTAGFTPGRMLTLSYFRLALLKNILPTSWLVGLDSVAQLSGNLAQLSPSVFIHNLATMSGETAPSSALFACPDDQTPLGEAIDGLLTCPTCGKQWAVENNLYNFKEPISSTKASSTAGEGVRQALGNTPVSSPKVGAAGGEVDRRALRQRGRMAAEPLLENSSLRDNMDDDQAQQLLDWGLAHTKAKVEQTITLPEEEAVPEIEKQVSAVSRVMHHLNKLVQQLPKASEAEVQQELQTLTEELGQVEEINPDLATQLQQIAQQRQTLAPRDLTNHLLNLLQQKSHGQT